MHKHEKVTTYRKQPDGTTKISTNSYYEELSHIMEEIEKPYTNLDSTAAQLILTKSLERITSKESPQVIITIKADNRGRGGIKIVEKYVSIKKSV